MNKQRIPRPLGLTELSFKYNTMYDNEAYNNLIQGLINHYTRNNFHYNGIRMTLEELSINTMVKYEELLKAFNNFEQSLGTIIDPKATDDLYRVIISKAIFGSLEDRSLIAQQLNMLLSSQGGSYKPFITGEVNKALKLMLDSTANFQSLLRMVPGSIGPFIPNAPEANKEDKGLTVDEVIGLLKSENVEGLLQSDKEKEKVYLEHHIEDAPEVCALKQVGIDTSKEGVGLKDITKLPKEKNKEKTHIDRRAQQLGIDLDDDEID